MLIIKLSLLLMSISICLRVVAQTFSQRLLVNYTVSHPPSSQDIYLILTMIVHKNLTNKRIYSNLPMKSQFFVSYVPPSPGTTQYYTNIRNHHRRTLHFTSHYQTGKSTLPYKSQCYCASFIAV